MGGRDMPTNPNVPLAEAPRYHTETLAGSGVLDPEQFLRQLFTEFLMQPAGIFGRCGPNVWSTPLIDEALDMNVCQGFVLEVSLARLI